MPRTIGARGGRRNLATTANTYTHVMVDPTEVDWAELLVRARAALSVER